MLNFLKQLCTSRKCFSNSKLGVYWTIFICELGVLVCINSSMVVFVGLTLKLQN